MRLCACPPVRPSASLLYIPPMTSRPDRAAVDPAALPAAQAIEDASRITVELMDELGRVIVGQRAMLERLLIGLLADGHVLLEGVPGLAKTLAVRTLAGTIAAGFHRIQFTPDLLPADLIGTQIYNQRSGDFTVQQGPIFTNLLLADEINRAPAKVQSALLEAMQERQVTIGGQTFPLPEPFLVLATQNPIEHEGTYPLPEAQVDRFMFKLMVTYPERREEREVLDRMTVAEEPTARRILDPERILQARRLVHEVYVDDRIKEYMLDLVAATRNPAAFGRAELAPADRVRRVAPGGDLPAAGGQGARLPAGPGLRHPGGREGARPRRAPPPGDPHLRAEAEGKDSDAVVRRILEAVAGAMTPEEVTHEVRRLEITTRHLVRDIMAGEYSSAFRGRGMEFAEVREYQPGDDVRTIDWNVTARLGSAYVKRFLEERELTVLFVVDVSASGGFGSPPAYQGRAGDRGGRRAGARGGPEQRPRRRRLRDRSGRAVRRAAPRVAGRRSASSAISSPTGPARRTPTWPARSPSWSRCCAAARSSSCSPTSWPSGTAPPWPAWPGATT